MTDEKSSKKVTVPTDKDLEEWFEYQVQRDLEALKQEKHELHHEGWWWK